MNDQFDTGLSTEQERQFQKWIAMQSAIRGRDLSRDLVNYDMRGYWKEMGSSDKGMGHFPDKFKKPNHPTFSDESIYHGIKNPSGGIYQGGTWQGDDKSGWRFTPSPAMAATPEQQVALKLYFQKNEPDVALVMPFR